MFSGISSGYKSSKDNPGFNSHDCNNVNNGFSRQSGGEP